MFSSRESMAFQSVVAELDLEPAEVEMLMREAKIPAGKEVLTPPELARVDIAVERVCHRLAGREWRRADGADREQLDASQLGAFDLFHRRTGERLNLKTFGQLLRWAESEYGWKLH